MGGKEADDEFSHAYGCILEFAVRRYGIALHAFEIYCRKDGGGTCIGGWIRFAARSSLRSSYGKDGKAPCFAAMIPMQVFNSLQVPSEAEKLRQVRHLIIGGGAVDQQLEGKLKAFPYEVWSTYGMTETLSHVALRRLSGEQASEWYIPFPEVSLSQTEEGTLVIEAPSVSSQKLVTNDIVAFDGRGYFKVVGRKDNTINTGGVKVQIEQVEDALRAHMPFPFMITSLPDVKFGECIVLLTEAEEEAGKQ